MRISDWSSDLCSSDLGARQVEIQLHPVAFGKLRRVVHANGGQVHRHSPYHRAEAIAQSRPPAIGKSAEIPVGIADLEDSELHLPIRREGRVVAYRVARADPSPLPDLSLDCHHLLDISSRLRAGPATLHRHHGPG